ncbi:MAG: hypothetical protein A3I77_04285 [Gammaproteobacteria bacterium RIFCSPLOWO2_02_FULL_42_14]|nr:MAG: hypothetical protein A3B71_05585 [Gammaproteobacteria bacterium RIFCSPHIGHO2_02_FULL_42_43]OGT28425.1 MAG: hypothetical protein A2624_01085 [Gammaproteobacteria bacterium RIFCSPHIGHO2_01_FULL_42_8]OGT51464.1 MAG: hypothetical protein A3E54_05350 [Gammaproteobacteria bacterium RIFCSPHIGHO2_12_FULL_41_25]OGT62165.1 MAG: hypothetical protein A3I77_04285 [Gammaproteobacteria bacterium RIFCSPLOWO2_02_FULL_42_14]OGT85838.1 MAG: hypothetical protein A3G86_03975 [Gammaproteobacteria bacterium R
MALKKFFRQLDTAIKAAEIKKLPIPIPTRYWSNFTRVSGAADQLYILKRSIADLEKKGSALNCLVVGVHGGRDYWGLKAWGHQVTGFDLGNVPDCPNIVFGSAEKDWPFDNHSFDLIVMGEILEHLQWDMHALQEARRVLKPSGALIVTVPFLASKPTYHVRLHDPYSIKKLLAINQFTIDDFLERPGFPNLKIMNIINFIIAAPWFLFTKKSLYGVLAAFFGKLEWELGHKKYLPRHLLRLFKLINWGATIKCTPSDYRLNYTETNQKVFTVEDV